MRGKKQAMHRKHRIALIALLLGAALITLTWGSYAWRRATLRQLAADSSAASSRHEWSKLEEVSHRWAELEPERAEPWLFRAEAAEALQDWSLMATCLGKIPHSDRRAIASLARKAGLEFEYLNRPWDGLATCDEIIKLDPRVLLAHKQAIFFTAMTLQRAEMVKRVRAAIRVRRESPESYVYLASASWFYGSSLYRHNTHWLESNPEDETFQVAQAMQIYMSEAKTNPAEAHKYEHIPPATELLQRYPHNLELLAYFINLAIEAGDADQVEQYLTAVPNEFLDSDARILRARAWKADTQGELSSAEELLRKAFELDPYWWKVHFQLHDLFRRLGNEEDSRRFLKIYDVSLPLAKTITEMNRSYDAFDDATFRTRLLTLSELVGDEEVAAALRSRLTSQPE